MYSSRGLTLTLPVIVCFSVVLRFTGKAFYKRENVLVAELFRVFKEYSAIVYKRENVLGAELFSVFKKYSALVAFIDVSDSTTMMITADSALTLTVGYSCLVFTKRASLMLFTNIATTHCILLPLE